METRIRVAGILTAEGFILLESFTDAGVWGIPGGSLEPGESLTEGCVREYQEETGLTITCPSLAIVHENFWLDHGALVHEYGYYFGVKPAEELF